MEGPKQWTGQSTTASLLQAQRSVAEHCPCQGADLQMEGPKQWTGHSRTASLLQAQGCEAEQGQDHQRIDDAGPYP